MLMDKVMAMMEKFVLELKEAEPEKRDHLVKTSVTLLQTSTELLKISPEFRRAFAEVHGEFLKYPECKETIEQGLETYKRFS